jgi:hypothetical protein
MCVLLAIFPKSTVAGAPMGGDFSAAERIISRALAGDTPIETIITPRSGLALRITQTTQRRAFAVESAGGQPLTLWQDRGPRDITFGTNLIPGESIVISTGASAKEAAARARQLPGVGAVLSNPLFRFWGETRDELPIWDMAARQWDRLLILMSPYGSEGSAPLIDGADPIGHCTSYMLDGEKLPSVLARWAASLADDPQLLWLADALAMDAAQSDIYKRWFTALSDICASSTLTGKLTLRVYLDTGDEVTAVTGSITIMTGGQTIPLSVDYRKRTSGSRVDKSLSLRALPSTGGDGFRLSLKESLTVDPKGSNRRSIAATLDGRMLGESFEAKLTASETNAWSLDSGSSASGAETFSGGGSFTLRAKERERLSVSFSGTGSARFDMAAPENTYIDRTTSVGFRWIEDERASVLANAAKDWLADALPDWMLDGPVEVEAASRSRVVEAMPQPAGISEDSTQQFTNLADMDEAGFVALAERLALAWERAAATLDPIVKSREN